MSAAAAPVTLDAGITLSDSLGSLSGATVTIGGFITGDTLNFTAQNGITGVYSNGVLTLTGTATTGAVPVRARLRHLQRRQQRSDRRR